MVRLRSDRWFSADGQRRSRTRVATQATGTRRLISLCFLLALVVLLMQRAADPRHVSGFFSALGVPLEAPQDTESAANSPVGTQATLGGASDTSQGTSETEEDSPWAITCRSLTERVFADLSSAQRSTVALNWFDLRSSRSADATQTSRQDSDREVVSKRSKTDDLATIEQLTLQVLEQIPVATEDVWAQQLERFKEEWENVFHQLEGQTDQVVDPTLAMAVSSYLDHALIAELKDAAPWNAQEQVAFARLLSQGAANPGPRAAAPMISTLQLESQAAVYKGNTVRFRGTVRRVEEVQPTQQSLVREPYSIIWLRGDDGSTQPIAVYAMSALVSSLESPRPDAGDFVEVEVSGVSAKRLAYTSPSGVQVAPTLFASQIRTLRVPSPQAGNGIGRNSRRPSTWWLYGVFVLAAIYFAWRMSSIRPLRQSSQHTNSILWFMASCCITATTLQTSLAIELVPPRPNQEQQAAGDAPAQQMIPPWARSEAEDRLRVQLIQDRLGSLMRSQMPPEVEAYCEDPSGPLPDAALKTLHLISQLGISLPGESPLKESTWSKGIAVDSPSGYRVELARWEGIVRLSRTVALSSDQRSWFLRNDREQVHFMMAEPKDGLQTVTEDTSEPAPTGEAQGNTPETQSARADLIPLLTRHAPSQWRTSAQLLQPFRVAGLRLSDPKGRTVCLFAERIQWTFEDTSVDQLQPELPEHLIALGSAGWDLAWLDTIAGFNQQPLQSGETDAFYGMLTAAEQIATVDKPSNLPQPTEEAADGVSSPQDAPASPLDFLRVPRDSIGRPLNWRVRLVNGSVVQAPKGRESNLGQDRYYQFNGFVDIGNQKVNYQFSRDGTNEVIAFEGEFPVTVVCKSPNEFCDRAALSADQLTWQVGRYVLVEGLFYRIWSYESELLAQRGSEARQAAPLIVAGDMTLAPVVATQQTGDVGWFGYALCLAVLLVLGWILWLASRKDPPRYRARTSSGI